MNRSGSNAAGEEWLCNVCGNVNYSHRVRCHMNVCSSPKGFPGPFRTPPTTPVGNNLSSWTCPSCGNYNRATRENCHRTGCPIRRIVQQNGKVVFVNPNPHQAAPGARAPVVPRGGGHMYQQQQQHGGHHQHHPQMHQQHHPQQQHQVMPQQTFTNPPGYQTQMQPMMFQQHQHQHQPQFMQGPQPGQIVFVSQDGMATSYGSTTGSSPGVSNNSASTQLLGSAPMMEPLKPGDGGFGGPQLIPIQLQQGGPQYNFAPQFTHQK